MNKDDIMRMAKESGAMFDHMTWVERDLAPVFYRFANLVAAAEREACAKLCDEIAIDMWALYKGRPPYKGNEEGRASDFTQGRSAGADDCAEAIRKRINT
jgi:hypothetical protein